MTFIDSYSPLRIYQVDVCYTVSRYNIAVPNADAIIQTWANKNHMRWFSSKTCLGERNVELDSEQEPARNSLRQLKTLLEPVVQVRYIDLETLE